MLRQQQPRPGRAAAGVGSAPPECSRQGGARQGARTGLSVRWGPLSASLGGLGALPLPSAAVLPAAVRSCSCSPAEARGVCASVSVCPPVRTGTCLWPSSGHSARAAPGVCSTNLAPWNAPVGMLHQRQDDRLAEAEFYNYQAWNFPSIDEECLGREKYIYL